MSGIHKTLLQCNTPTLVQIAIIMVIVIIIIVQGIP